MNEQQQMDIQWRRGRKKGTMILAEIKAPGCTTIYRILFRNNDKRSYCEMPTFRDIPNSHIKRYAIIKE